MKLVADAGVWTAGPVVAGPPAVAVLELSGAVLAWTVDDPTGAAATRITVTDVAAADWLWRVVGPTGHAAISAALDGRAGDAIDLTDVELLPAAVAPLRRLAVGHWLRRWWPESSRDGVAHLDQALLDGELAVLTSAAEEFFTEDTLDSDVDGLLAPHRSALVALASRGDPRIVDLARSCALLAEESGVWPAHQVDESAPAVGRRADYALAAGPDTGRAAGSIAGGVGSVNWIAVPPGVFDAADGTVDWSVSSADGSMLATVRVATTGGAGSRGIEVRLRSGAVSAAGVLDARGTVAMALLGAGDLPLTETQAWDHDWSATAVAIGPNGTDSIAAQALRQRVRDVARARLARPGPDAFLAEVVAAEFDY